MKRILFTLILSFFLATPNFAQNKRFIQAITGGHSILLGSPPSTINAYNLFDTLATVVDSVLSELINRGINPYNYVGLSAAYTQAVNDGNFLFIPATYSTDSSVTYTTAPIIDFRNGRVTITPLSFEGDSISTWYDIDTDTIRIDPSALNVFEYLDGSQRFWAFDSTGRVVFTDGDGDSLIFDPAALFPIFYTDSGTNLMTGDSAGGLFLASTLRAVGALTLGDSTTGDNDVIINFADDGNLTAESFKWDDGTGTFILSEDLTVGDGGAGIDYVIKVDGETNDGTITWQEDENYFRANKFWAYPRRLDFDAIAWYPPTTGGATLTTIATYEEVYAFSDSDTLFHKFRLHSSYSAIDSIEMFVSPQNADGDSVALTVLLSGKAEGETWGAWNTAGADTVDLGTTSNARVRMVLVPSVGTLSANDIVRWAIIRDGSISDDASVDVNFEDSYFYIR